MLNLLNTRKNHAAGNQLIKDRVAVMHLTYHVGVHARARLVLLRVEKHRVDMR